LSEIDLHDARHSYATPGPDAKIDWKALSQRIDHADVAFTMKQYVQTDLEANRQVANTLAELIIGGSLASFEITETGAPRIPRRTADPDRDRTAEHRSRPGRHQRSGRHHAPQSASWSRSRRCRPITASAGAPLPSPVIPMTRAAGPDRYATEPRW
jgi:hypothetical protein